MKYVYKICISQRKLLLFWHKTYGFLWPLISIFKKIYSSGWKLLYSISYSRRKLRRRRENVFYTKLQLKKYESYWLVRRLLKRETMPERSLSESWLSAADHAVAEGWRMATVASVNLEWGCWLEARLCIDWRLEALCWLWEVPWQTAWLVAWHLAPHYLWPGLWPQPVWPWLACGLTSPLSILSLSVTLRPSTRLPQSLTSASVYTVTFPKSHADPTWPALSILTSGQPYRGSFSGRRPARGCSDGRWRLFCEAM